MKQKFSLLELLIVIAIIGILLSLLLPSLMSAKEKARIAVCLSNQSQLHRSTSLHVKDFDGLLLNRTGYSSRYPGGLHDDANYGNSPNYELDWGKKFEAYLPGFTIEEGSEIFSCPSQNKPAYRTTIKGWAITDYSYWATLEGCTTLNDTNIPSHIAKAESDWALFTDAAWQWSNSWQGYNHGPSSGNFYADDNFTSSPANGTQPTGLAEVYIDGSAKWGTSIRQAVITPWNARVYQLK